MKTNEALQQIVEEVFEVVKEKVDGVSGDLATHEQNTSNPHSVTKSQVGLGNVTNDKQIKGNASGTTEDHIVVFGADGYSVKDSGKTLADTGKIDTISIDGVDMPADNNKNVDLPTVRTDINNQGLSSTQKTNAKTNLDLENVVNTGDSATPTENGTDKFTTGGAYNLLQNINTKFDKAKIGIIELDESDIDPDTGEFTLSSSQMLELPKEYCVLIIHQTGGDITFYKDTIVDDGNSNLAVFNTLVTNQEVGGVVSQGQNRVMIDTTTGEGKGYQGSQIFYNSTKIDTLLATKLNNSNVATIETTTTASKAYEIDDLLIYNETLYVVTSPIAQGGTITVNSNVSATTIEEAIKNSSVKIKEGFSKNWENKSGTGLPSYTMGSYFWNDGEKLFYSSGTTQKVYNEDTKTWSNKSGTSPSSFYGNYIGTDGIDTYYSNNNVQMVLNKTTEQGENMTWNGTIGGFYGYSIGTDNEHIYYSNGTTHYELNVATHTGTEKEWLGLTDFDGGYVGVDGDDVFYGYQTSQYKLNKSTSTWSAVTGTGLSEDALQNFDGRFVWTDGTNTYYSSSFAQKVLDKPNLEGKDVTGTNITSSFLGYNVGTWDGNIYYEETKQLGIASHKTDYLSVVAETGSYNDLKDKPSYKTVGGNSILGDGNIEFKMTQAQFDAATSGGAPTNPVDMYADTLYINAIDGNYQEETGTFTLSDNTTVTKTIITKK